MSVSPSLRAAGGIIGAVMLFCKKQLEKGKSVHISSILNFYQRKKCMIQIVVIHDKGTHTRRKKKGATYRGGK